MLLPLTTPEEMRTWDRETIETIGIPGATLMESASREAVQVLLEEFGPVDGAEIHCFAGSGNNGGDAFAMARQLQDLGADVTVFHTRPGDDYTGETALNYQWATKLDVPMRHLADVELSTLPQPDIVVDGLLGTGFDGELRPDYLELVRTINKMGRHAFVLAVDIPSGLNGMTGLPQPEAVIADVTATFQAAKVGLALPESSRFTGLVHVCPIGIPGQIQAHNPPRHYLISEDAMALIPDPAADMHKGTAGNLLIVGGSGGLVGAPHLSAKGAMRSGVGLVTVAGPGGIVRDIKANVPEIMTLALGTGTTWSPALLPQLQDVMGRYDAVVFGPGLGRDNDTIDFLRVFLEIAPQRLVLDADAIYCLSKCPDLFATLDRNTILTPHPGEMGMLMGTDNTAIQQDRLGTAEAFGEKCAATLVLKGAGTIVTDTETVCISPFATPNLAVGGSGDILAGVIGSLYARGFDPLEAACTGVYWHGLAGSLLKEDFPLRGNTATDIVNMLPRAAKESLQC